MRAYRFLLRVFPASFRRRFGDDMADVFADRWRTARARGGRAMGALAGRTVIDTVRHGMAERRAGRVSRRGHVWSSVMQDLRYALRTLRRRPGFTAAALATLALAIGANTAIFSVFHAVLLRGLPFPDADRLVLIYGTHARYNFDRGVISPFDYDIWEQRSQTLERLAAIRPLSQTLTGAGDAASIRITQVTPAFFDVLGVSPSRGRVFSAAETEQNERVLVLSDAIWATRFDRADDIIGRAVVLDDVAWTVIGVMPPGLVYPEGVDIWQPLHLSNAVRAEMGAWFLGGIGRIRDHVSLDDVRREFDGLARDLAATYPKERGDRGFNVVGVHDDLGIQIAGGLRVLQGAVALVLLIACANIANLLLASSAGRQREFAIRSALGGSRARLFRQSLTESLVLACGSAALGVLLAVWGVRVLVALAPARLLPYPETIGVNGVVLAFTLGTAVVTGLLFGLAPAISAAWRRRTVRLSDGVRAAATGLGWRRGHRLRGTLVAVEVAMAIVLLSGAGLLVRSYAIVLSQSPGFDTKHLLTARLSLPQTRYPTNEARAAFWSSVTAEVGRLPGVTDVATTSAVPFSLWEFQADFTIRGREHIPNDGSGVRSVSSSFFETIGLPVLRGRGFTADDERADAAVVVVSDTFAAEHMPGLDPIGQSISWRGPAPRWHTVVGVVGSTRHLSLEEPLRAEIYRVIPTAAPPASLAVALRTSARPAAWEASLREAVARVDPALPVLDVASVEDLIDSRLARRRFRMVLLGLFAALAGTLAMTGIYGVLAFIVTGARREVGIRLALGARQGQVQRHIVRQGLAVVAVGSIAGVLVAWWLARLFAGQVFRISTTDPVTFGAVFAGLLATSALACWIPAARAGRVPAAAVLRDE